MCCPNIRIFFITLRKTSTLHKINSAYLCKMHIPSILSEIKITAISASGPGGQHVNKVATKVVLHFDIQTSKGLNDTEKNFIFSKLHNRINNKGILILTDEHSRSQYKNKENLIKKFIKLLQNALIKPKKRKPTKPSKSSVLKRLKSKKKQSDKKKLRHKKHFDWD